MGLVFLGKQSDAGPGSQIKWHQCTLGVCVHNVRLMEWNGLQSRINGYRVVRYDVCTCLVSN